MLNNGGSAIICLSCGQWLAQSLSLSVCSHMAWRLWIAVGTFWWAQFEDSAVRYLVGFHKIVLKRCFTTSSREALSPSASHYVGGIKKIIIIGHDSMLGLLCLSSLKQFGLNFLSAIKSLSTTDHADPVKTGSLSRLVPCLFKCPDTSTLPRASQGLGFHNISRQMFMLVGMRTELRYQILSMFLCHIKHCHCKSCPNNFPSTGISQTEMVSAF